MRMLLGPLGSAAGISPVLQAARAGRAARGCGGPGAEGVGGMPVAVVWSGSSRLSRPGRFMLPILRRAESIGAS